MNVFKKSIGLSIFFILTAGSVDAQHINQKKIDGKGNEMLLGPVDKNGLISGTYSSWFNQQYRSYDVDKIIIKSIKNELRTYNLKVFMGTWCGDSKREAPRFYKLLEEANYPMAQLQVIALDYEGDQYKKSPGGEEKGLNIIKVPTFIVYKNGKEVNRIVEEPVVSLEKDLYTIIRGGNYLPNYSTIPPVLPQD